jgi:LmbE family N-acetylglucosaminyl deacetylase
MQFTNPTADSFVPDNVPLTTALARTTHIGVGAHQDDLEIMALHGILECLGQPDKWFTGITCTNGGGSSRTGPYASCTDRQMQEIRRREQRTAAVIGQYSAMLQLDYPSSIIKDPSSKSLAEDLFAIFSRAKPAVVYTHNPADKHDTHIAVLIPTIEALQRLPASDRPKKVYGCEVWRNLDWLPDEDKVALDVSGRQNLAAALVSVFDSQIAGGKRYDLASQGRRRANATYFQSHQSDAAQEVIFAIDLTPVVADTQDLAEYVMNFVENFKADVRAKLTTRVGKSNNRARLK